MVKTSNSNSYHDEVKWLIETYYLEFGRNELPANRLEQMAAGWMVHFGNAGIPKARLQDIYYKAVALMERNEFFTPTTIIRTWEQLKIEELNSAPLSQTSTCEICKGTQKVLKMRFNGDDAGTDEVVKCPCTLSNPIRQEN